MTPRPCQGPSCRRPAVGPGERFCWHHRAEEVRRLLRVGYLAPLPPATAHDGSGFRGCSAGDFENAVRALEG